MSDYGPQVTPEEFYEIEGLLSEYVRRKQAEIPLVQNRPNAVGRIIKSIQTSTELGRVRNRQLLAELDRMKADTDRRIAADMKRALNILAKAVSDTRELLAKAEGHRPAAYVARIRQHCDAIAAQYGLPSDWARRTT